MKNKGFIESQKNNKTNKKTKWTKAHTVVFIMILFFTIGSIFGIYGGISSCKTAKADNVTSVTTFVGSNIVIPCSLYSNDGNGNISDIGEWGYLTYDNTFVNDGYSLNLSPTFILDFQSNQAYLNNFFIANLTDSNDDFDLDYNITTNNGINTLSFLYDNSINYGSILFDLYGGFSGSGINSMGFTFSCRVSISDIRFSGDIYKIHIWGDILYGTNYFSQRITYTDVNGYTMTFVFFANSIGSRLGSNALRFAFDDRTYYLDNTLDNDEIYNQGFNDGKSQGFNDGYQDGITVGERNKEQAVEQALNSGFHNGYNKGKADGIASANDYTFLSLLGAVVDAPLNSITSFFDFNLLGFNMANFFWAIMTCIVILGIIKVIFGRGG